MGKTEVLATAIDMARAGLGFTPTDALACIADLIDQEDAESASYDSNVERLLRLGACIWTLRRGMFAPAAAEIAAEKPSR
ncbi:hypothetical protein [Variovorax sp. PAMC26660]|uniref:hypothetical protein n=1 Tax=Variovorax sp. PAMC26660 TaxID=2762322 RepID=UPI00164E238A|nr:hypothetical protein [Variovorax sp. PAMC26660]QNK65855.1 hypothetical protein H7F35_21905 [Variovorax sp. PAMC26660]